MAKISKMIDDITGKTEQEQQERERFTFLQKMAKAKSDNYQTRLEMMLSSGTIGQVQIVGKRAFRYYDSQHVNISHSCDSAITEAIDDFFKGKDGVKDGFQKIVKQSITWLIGESSIGESEEHMFFVYPENNVVVRADVMAYKYNFSTKGILAKDVENVFVYTMAKSIVDHTSLSLDELLYMVTEMAGAENASLDVVKQFIAELRECWRMLEESNATPDQMLAEAEAYADALDAERGR